MRRTKESRRISDFANLRELWEKAELLVVTPIEGYEMQEDINFYSIGGYWCPEKLQFVDGEIGYHAVANRRIVVKEKENWN